MSLFASLYGPKNLWVLTPRPFCHIWSLYVKRYDPLKLAVLGPAPFGKGLPDLYKQLPVGYRTEFSRSTSNDMGVSRGPKIWDSWGSTPWIGGMADP